MRGYDSHDWSKDDLSEYDDESSRLTKEDNRSLMTSEQKIAVLDEIFSSGGHYALSEVVELSGFPRANVYRYVKKLRELQAPLEKDKEGKYYYTNPTFRIPHLMTTKSQFIAAREMVNLLETMKGQPFYDEVKKVFDLLSTAAPKVNEYGDEYDSAVNRDASKPSRKIFLGAPAAGFSEEIWNTISRAMDMNHNIKFNYQYVDGYIESKTVQPWQLVFDKGNWNLWCYDYKRKDTRILTVVQMTDVVITEDSFVLPEDFDLRKVTPGFFGAYVNNESYNFRIKFMKDSYVVSRVIKRIWGLNQTIETDEEGNTIISFDSNQYDPILTWIRSWGQYAVPLAPECLVEDWKDGIIQLNKIVLNM